MTELTEAEASLILIVHALERIAQALENLIELKVEFGK